MLSYMQINQAQRLFRVARSSITLKPWLITRVFLQGCFVDKVAAHKIYHPGERKVAVFQIVEIIRVMKIPPGPIRLRYKVAARKFSASGIFFFVASVLHDFFFFFFQSSSLA